MEFLIIFIVYTARVYCINDGKGWDNAPNIGRQRYEDLEDTYENITGSIIAFIGLFLIIPMKRWLKIKMIIMSTFGIAFFTILIISQMIDFSESQWFYWKLVLIPISILVSIICSYFASKKPIVILGMMSLLSGLLLGMTLIRMGIISYPLGRTVFTLCVGLCGMMIGLSFKDWAILVCINWNGIELIIHGIDLAIEFGYVQFNQIGWHRIYESPPPLISGLIFLSFVSTIFMIYVRWKLVGKQTVEDITRVRSILEEFDTNSAFSVEVKIGP